MSKFKRVLSIEGRLQLIVEAVLYCQKVKELGMPSSCYSKALREPVFFLWEQRNKGHKYDNAEYRSIKSIGIERGKNLLVYDHSILFIYVQNKLLELEDVSQESVKKVLNEYLCSCVITKDEDRMLSTKKLGRRMPEKWSVKDKLVRYRLAGIEIEKNDSN